MGSPLQEKSKAFALQIIKVCNEGKREKRESVLTNQLALEPALEQISEKRFMPMVGLIL